MKSEQLQIRVSGAEKRAIAASAKVAGVSISEWALSMLLSPRKLEFEGLLHSLARASEASRKWVFASLNDFLTDLSADELRSAVSEFPEVDLNTFSLNYVAAMVETACNFQDISAPSWAYNIDILEIPYFATELISVRMHLLLRSPPAFRKRNIFIDSSLGDRV